MNPKQLMSKFDDAVERHRWLKQLQFALVDALIVGAITWVFDHSQSPLGTAGHIWFLGYGIVCFLAITGLTIWTGKAEDLGEIEGGDWYYCEVCGDHKPFSHFPHEMN